MSILVCPKCKTPLFDEGNSLFCQNRHCFDKSKYKYVNLLLQNGGQTHGDNKLMIKSRKSFLDKGYYCHLRVALCQSIIKYLSSGVILDAGCGEGYYTVNIKNALQTEAVYGIDVSRDAVHAASLRDKSLRLAVASIFDLPVPSESIDVLINLFAPYDGKEFSRVLKEGGLLVRAFPAERHLWELKCAVYDTPYENEIDTLVLEGFVMVKKDFISFPLHLTSGAEIDSLFKMTPYYYKTSRDGQARLAALENLQTHAEFYLVFYKKA